MIHIVILPMESCTNQVTVNEMIENANGQLSLGISVNKTGIKRECINV